MKDVNKEVLTEILENDEHECTCDSDSKCCDNTENCCSDDKNSAEELTDETVEIQPEKEDFEKKYYYLAAEMDNLRKRFQRERENFIKFGNERILKDLIEVLDTFDHCIIAIEKNDDEKSKQILSGIQMARKQFYDALAKNGLEQIEAMGVEFDPNFHEAMAQQAIENKKNHEIIAEYQKGYILNGRLLRPSKVVIAKEIEKD